MQYRWSFSLDEALPAFRKLDIPVDALALPNGRNRFHFPPAVPMAVADRDRHLTVLSNALVFLGCIAFYRGVASIIDKPRRKLYDRARACYEQAKLLTPCDGNASHQLAILATHEKDPFAALVHYYRSLCAERPFSTTSEDMGRLFDQALDPWNAPEKAQYLPTWLIFLKLRIDDLKERVVRLHGLWRLGLE